MVTICAKIAEVLLDPQVVGVVVSHGTDTMEETAFLADLVHADQRPVVFTGAQFSADSVLPDGPGNLLQAIAVAAAPAAAGHGVLLSFFGAVFRARGVRKTHTQRLDAFANPDFGVAGTVSPEGIVAMNEPESHPAPLPLPTGLPSTRQRVDVVCSYPGADHVLVQASVAAGATGLVLQGTGSGNANPALCKALQEAIGSGVTVVTSTRVDAGPVVPVYGAGGGLDLKTAGAIPSGSLRPSQSLILLNLLLRLGADRESVSAAFAEYGLIAQPATNY
jgi:L-asparaginase